MKILKWLLIVMVGLIAILSLVVILVSEHLPENGREGKEADQMALRMETALGKEYWDEIQFVQWTFMDTHHFLWDKHRNMVRVKWGANTVYFEPGNPEGMAFDYTQRISDSNKTEKLLKTAKDYFNNDMFWLVAPFKAFDKGVKREVVDYEGEKRLLVTYNDGGSTPGDSYLWKLEEDGTPVSFKMWTQILPIGGLETSWENYFEFGNGARIAHFHKGLGPLSIVVSDVSTGYNFEEIEYEKDPFKIFLEK